jgi:hypothetical protein
MTLYHKWGVKLGFAFGLQFFMLISDSLGGVEWIAKEKGRWSFLFFSFLQMKCAMVAA